MTLGIFAEIQVKVDFTPIPSYNSDRIKIGRKLRNLTGSAMGRTALSLRHGLSWHGR